MTPVKRGRPTIPALVRFWKHVDKSGDCWLWLGAKTYDGYGTFRVDAKTVTAHRWIYQQMNGGILPIVKVLHYCDNPSCVNPAHLWLGTDKDNAQDRERKGRGNHHNESAKTKLTREAVRAIREAYSPAWGTTMALARQYNVSHAQIRRIVNAEQWRDVA